MKSIYIPKAIYIPDNKLFPRSHALYLALKQFSEKMEAASALTDGVLTARIVGEFSAGKTRVLRELFGDLIPEPLYPLSSLERQTRLQLEITYGDIPELELIKRNADYDPAQFVRALAHFPAREDLHDLDPMSYRLRLSLKEPQLILSAGDGYTDDKTPKRLFLIDTPGWNSGEDLLSEHDASEILIGHHNLALIYVSQAARVDGAVNEGHLRNFLDALSKADFLDQTRLIFIVTSCPVTDQERFRQIVKNRVTKLWAELEHDPEKLSLEIFCVDFAEISINDLRKFRAAFWQALLEPLQKGHSVSDPWVMAIRNWPAAWDINPLLIETFRLLESIQGVLKKARQKTSRGNEFVVGMNMSRLIGLKAEEVRNKVKTAWFNQLACNPEYLKWHLSPLPAEHPLSDWFQIFWLGNLELLLTPTRAFFDAAQKVINTLTPNIQDLQQHLSGKLDALYAKALLAHESSFNYLVEITQKLISEPHIEKRIANLSALSLIQARYEDYYALHIKKNSWLYRFYIKYYRLNHKKIIRIYKQRTLTLDQSSSIRFFDPLMIEGVMLDSYLSHLAENSVRLKFEKQFRMIEEPLADLRKMLLPHEFLGIQFIWIPGGNFNMGSPDNEKGRFSDEGPVHKVCVDGFWMAKYPVTQGQWKNFMDNNPAKFQKGDNYPIECVTWHDAQDFIKKLNAQLLGRCRFRLPTEAEWEYACRAGTITPFYCGSTLTSSDANFDHNIGVTTPVESYPPNPFGLYDMHGNVWEWCEDGYDPNFYSKKEAKLKNPLCNPSSNNKRVLRGGSWSIYPSLTRAVYRYWRYSDYQDSDVGFRLVCIT